VERLVSAAPQPRGSFGALLRAGRHRALLSQEQLAERAELSERTVRNLEAGRVRSPRPDTARLLADALQLTGPERENWFAAARGMNNPWAEPGGPKPGGPAPLPGDVRAWLRLSAYGADMENNPQRLRLLAGEFAVEIVALYLRADPSAGQAARVGDLFETAVRAQSGRAGPDAETADDGGLNRTERRELAQLRYENRRLREDVEILRWATAIFATATR